MKRKTPKTPKATIPNLARYEKAGHSICPFCGSKDIEGGSFDVTGDEVSQELTCQKCDRRWYEFYILTSISDRDSGFVYQLSNGRKLDGIDGLLLAARNVIGAWTTNRLDVAMRALSAAIERMGL
jgi:predicted nucleic-acid-binding Zn-ribbon protein